MKRNLDMLHGPIWTRMTAFALPLILSSALQQLFHAADIAVIGHFAGAAALAAVGANSSIINLLINLIVGLSAGINAMVSRCIGEGKPEKVSAAIHASAALGLILGVAFCVLGVVLAMPVLTLMGVPAEIADPAARYLTIYFLGMPFIVLYNFAAAVLRSKGDTKRPVLALIAAGVLNVLLNLFFVTVLHKGVSGVAAATVMANGAAALCMAVILIREKGEFRFSWRKLSVDFKILKEIACVGVPAGLQGMIFSISNLIVQTAINKLGPMYIAGNMAAAPFDYLPYFIYSAFNHAALTFISHNYAARNLARARKCAMWAIVLSVLSGLAVNIAFILTRHSAIGLFTTDPEVQRIACIRIVIMLSFEFFNGILEVCSGILRGFGKPVIPTVTVLVGVCGIRIVMVCFMPPMGNAYQYLMASFPVAWIAASLVLTAASLRVMNRIRREEKLQIKRVPAIA